MQKPADKTISKQRTLAKSRWKLIYHALKKDSTNADISSDLHQNVSVLRFKSFGFVLQKDIEDSKDCENASWSHCTCSLVPEFSLKIRQLNLRPTAKDLIGFNNTGNVCIWPAEEVLTYYCLKNRSFLRSKSVCELGGGMTCLAGLAVACSSDANEVVVTDGNEQSCQNAETIRKENTSKFGCTQVSVKQVLWNKEETFADLREKFDMVLGADCFFFDEYRQDLVNTITSILKPGGTAWMFAPHRGSTLRQFESIAQKNFSTNLVENYDHLVWERHQNMKSTREVTGQYDEDIHYPWMLTLCKR